jgi:hypothetical protein
VKNARHSSRIAARIALTSDSPIRRASGFACLWPSGAELAA